MDCSPQAPVSVECSRQEYWSGLPFPIPGALPDPGMEPASLALAGGVFSSEPPGKPHLLINTGKLIASKCHCSKEWGYLDHLCIFGRGSKCAMGRRQVWEGNSRPVVPNLYGTRERFHGRQFFMDPGHASDGEQL